MIHVLVADRVPLFRCGIRAALESTPECKVVGEATERAGIIQLLQEQHPDVIVLDAGLLAPDDLFEVTDALRPLACGLVVLTASADEEQLFQYLKLGAAAYESRDITPACLADRVRRVVQKEYLLSRGPGTYLHLSSFGSRSGDSRIHRTGQQQQADRQITTHF